MGARVSEANRIEFERLDKNGIEDWFNMQNQIIDRQRESAGAVEEDLTFSLMHEFKKQIERSGSNPIYNTGCIRKILKDQNKTTYEMEARLHPEIGGGFEVNLSYPDDKGRVFIIFEDHGEEGDASNPKKISDNKAKAFFRDIMGLDSKYDPPAKNLLSFGANVKLLGADLEKFGMPNIERLARNLNTCYVDSMRLPEMASSYKTRFDDGSLSHPLNVWWQEYYQKAMEKAEIMTFVITKGWIASGNCWQEAEWARTYRAKERNLKTLFVFSDEEHVKTLKNDENGNKKIFRRKLANGKWENFCWMDIITDIGYDKEFEKNYKVVKNVEQIEEYVKSWESRSWWPFS